MKVVAPQRVRCHDSVRITLAWCLGVEFIEFGFSVGAELVVDRRQPGLVDSLPSTFATNGAGLTAFLDGPPAGVFTVLALINPLSCWLGQRSLLLVWIDPLISLRVRRR